ncbi:MAG: isopentenyl phosphate kinase [Anaerolineales bacterium]|nr:isopentenyl phosphate kinase [Anaerolineales bacterium]
MFVFLKLGGSLITDKSRRRTIRPDVLEQAAAEIAAALSSNPRLKILLGHGSGSFGHISGEKYGTRDGVSTIREWQGFSRVARDAASLNHRVMKSLHSHNLPAIAFPPSSSIISRQRQITTWDLSPLKAALHQGLIPVVFGDVCFDTRLGGTILSTEELFASLARELNPDRILLAGKDPGVWSDYPQCTTLIPEITPATFSKLQPALHSSQAIDVTGGMRLKIQQMLNLIEELPDLEVLVFSGREPGNLKRTLTGEQTGTLLIRE